MPTWHLMPVVQGMHMSSHDLASQFHGIKENLHKLREAIEKVFPRKRCFFSRG